VAQTDGELAVYNISDNARVCSPFPERRESQGLKVRVLGKAEELATEHRELIIRTWHERFDR
jgi:hypothetical protein